MSLACGALGAASIAVVVLLATATPGAAPPAVARHVGTLVAGGMAIACAGLAARSRQGRPRLAWSALTVGLLGWFAGAAVLAYADLVPTTQVAPFPFLADAGALVFPVATCVALLLLPVGVSGQSRRRLLVDGVIVAASLFVIFWASGLDDVVTYRGQGRLAFAVSVAHLIGDWAVLTVALVVLTRVRAGQRATIAVLATAIGVMTISDVAATILRADGADARGSAVAIGWVAGLLLLACGARIGARTANPTFDPTHAPARTAQWLPYLLLPPATVAVVGHTGSEALLVATLVLVSAALAGQFLGATENRRLLEQVADQALRDPLTGLANRALFRDRLTHAVALEIRDAHRVAVLSIDLDDFKRVNDSLGHPTGDALLKAVAGRLLTCVRTGDTVARLGGDEFAILLEGGTEPLTVAHRVSDAFDEPFTVDGHEVFSRPSVGVATGASPQIPDGDPARSAEILLKQADLAMYAAKRSQLGGVHPFTEDMELIDVREVDPARSLHTSARRHYSAGLFGQLRRAIDQDELSVVYQPKFTVSSGLLAGVEALVRWEHPQRGLMLPDEFLPLARQNGLMGALTEAVVHRAVRDAADWRARGRDVSIAVNLFPPSLGDPELPSRIVRVLTGGGLPSECLTVEITEDFLLGNLDRARDVLKAMRESRIRVAIDDFGSGYSALSYLRELPIDELKLDRTFIAPILHDDRAEAIVCAIIDLTHRLGMTCVAEGVENAATATLLGEYGCDTIQGYYCSPPVDAGGVLEVGPLLPASAR